MVAQDGCGQSVFAKRDIAKSHVRTALVVFDPPCVDGTSRFGQRLEPMNVQTLVAQLPVERLDERVIRRLAEA